jgi:hypothetical protein
MRGFIAGIFAGYAIFHAVIANAATGSTLKVCEDRIAVRMAPGLEAPVVMYLKRGRKLKELRRSGVWVKGLVFGEIGKEGWVRASQVIVVDGNEERASKFQTPAVPRIHPGPNGPRANFVLVVKGAPQRFRASCLILGNAGKSKRLQLEGRTPKFFEIREGAVDCRVDRLDQHAGTLSVALYAEGRSIPAGSNSTHGPFGCVHVRSRGPWGKAFGRRCSREAFHLR